MTQRSAFIQASTRLAASVAAAGLLFASAALAQTTLPPPQQYGSADARQDRLQELEQALRDSTSENERLQNELNQRDREIRRLQNLVDEAVGVNRALTTPPADGQAPTGGTPPSAPRAENGGQSGLNSAQQAATGTLGSIPAGTPLPAPATTPAPTADELYTRARAHLNAGRLAEAEVDFAAFLEAYPNVTQTTNAHYWYGRTLLARNNHEAAAQSFYQYLRRAPRGPNAADAQVNLGVALVGMGRRDQGCAALTGLTENYPNATAAQRELAAREARAARCAR
jgi:tol-pal system protein YbgF